jgi:hypothetical protein
MVIGIASFRSAYDVGCWAKTPAVDNDLNGLARSSPESELELPPRRARTDLDRLHKKVIARYLRAALQRTPPWSNAAASPSAGAF